MNLRRTAVLLAFLAPAAAGAQVLAPLILRLPAGPRTLALGNTGIGSRDDEAIFFNPAQLAIANGFSVSGEYLSSTAGTGAMSAVTRFNGGGIGIGMKMANYDTPVGVILTDRHTMLDEGPAAGASYEASVGIAQTIKGVRAGIVGKYAVDEAASARIGRPLADIGLAKDMFRTTFGLAVQNIGKDGDINGDLYHVPVKTTLGFAHSRSAGPYDILVTGAASLIRDEFFQPSGGLEINYSWLSGYNIAVRGGVRRSTIGEEPLTAGAGFTMDRLSIDYALETLSNRRVGQRIGLRIR